MSYYCSKLSEDNFENVIRKIEVALKDEEFEILTEIDVKELFKKKINVDFRKYKIFGACHPAYAFIALRVEDKIGVMLPCNVIVQETENGVEIAAADPIALSQTSSNQDFEQVVLIIREKLQAVIEKL